MQKQQAVAMPMPCYGHILYGYALCAIYTRGYALSITYGLWAMGHGRSMASRGRRRWSMGDGAVVRGPWSVVRGRGRRSLAHHAGARSKKGRERRSGRRFDVARRR